MKYIYHHLGLGDHLVCNSIVRYFARLDEKIVVLSKTRNAVTVQRMYRDLTNVHVTSVGGDAEARNLLDYVRPTAKILIGYSGKDYDERIGSFDTTFYNQVGLSIQDKFAGWKIDRDFSDEAVVQKSLTCGVKHYAFVHEDVDRGYVIDKSKIGPVSVQPKGKTISFFLYCKLIEEAEEVHCINSSFLHLCDFIKPSGKLFFHISARDDGRFSIPVLQCNWTKV